MKSDIEKPIVQVQEFERDKIYRLNRRLDALYELFDTFQISKIDLCDTKEIKNEILQDVKLCKNKIRKWWEIISNKYNLTEKCLFVNYQTGQITYRNSCSNKVYKEKLDSII